MASKTNSGVGRDAPSTAARKVTSYFRLGELRVLRFLATLVREGVAAAALLPLPFRRLAGGWASSVSIISSSAELNSASPLGRRSWPDSIFPDELLRFAVRFMMQHYATSGPGAKARKPASRSGRGFPREIRPIQTPL